MDWLTAKKSKLKVEGSWWKKTKKNLKKNHAPKGSPPIETCEGRDASTDFAYYWPCYFFLLRFIYSRGRILLITGDIMVFEDIDSTLQVGTASSSRFEGFTQRWHKLRKEIIRHKLHVYVPIAFIIVILFSFITIFFVHVEPNLGVGVAEGTQFDANNVKLLGLGDQGGIDLQVSGTNINNFTNIDDFWIRQYFKKGGSIIRSLNLKIDELDLIVNDSEKNEDLNLGKIEIQPFFVKIVDGANTNLDLLVTLWPNARGTRGLLKKLLLESGAKLRLRGDANVRVYVLNGFVPVSSISIPLDVEI